MSGKIRWVATAIFTLLIIPVITANIQKLLELKHWDEFLLNWWPNMPNLNYVINSNLIWTFLVFSGGLAAALWVIRMWPERKTKSIKFDTFVSLKEAVQQLYDKCMNRILCKQFVDEHIRGTNTPPQEAWKNIAELFLRCTSIPIHGIDIYSGKMVEISLSENYINNIDFDDNINSITSLIGNHVKFTDLCIKTDEIDKAINDIIQEIEITKKQL